MSENRFENVPPVETDDAPVAEMQPLRGATGSESRVADEVAPRALLGRFRYAKGLGWMRWDGRRWEVGPNCEEYAHQAVRRFIDLVERQKRAESAELEAELKALEAKILAEADAEEVKATAGDAKARKKLIQQHATDEQRKQYDDLMGALIRALEQAAIWLNMTQATRIEHITKLARRDPGILTDAAELDMHHDLLNVHNGVVDLRTGKMRQHDPKLLITHLAGAHYDPEARHDGWDKVLSAVPQDALEYLQTRIGQAFTGHAPDDDSLLLSDGGGENGKSTFFAAIEQAAGSYYTLVSERVLTAQPGQHPTEVMDLRGARVAVMEETPEEGRLDTHQLKKIVGTPRISARRMHKDSVSWAPTHSLFVNTNHLPQVDATDHGTWRRLKRLRWPYKYVRPGAECQPHHRAGDRTLKFQAQNNPQIAAAALAWAVKGAVAWYAQRGDEKPEPTRIVDDSADWNARSDVGLQFIRERLVADPDAFIRATRMRAEFNLYLAQQGKREWSSQTLNTRLADTLDREKLQVTATPARPFRVRAGEAESLPAGVFTADVAKKGDLLKGWRGVRFMTDKELREQGTTLKAV